MTFGIDEKSATKLLGGDVEQAQALIALFGGGESHINALELLCAIGVYSKGGQAEVIKSLFTTFDFNDKAQISSAELIIMYISTLRAMMCAIKHKAAGDNGPKDEDVEKLVDAHFKEDEEIALSQFSSFLEKTFFKKNTGISDVMNFSYALCQAFSLDVPAPQVAEEARPAEEAVAPVEAVAAPAEKAAAPAEEAAAPAEEAAAPAEEAAA
eukprot:Stramenopile-MAST_4_protein_6620